MLRSKYVFTEYPDDWRGRTIEVWHDGTVTLDSGLTSAERKSAGKAPSWTLVISENLSGGEMLDWIGRRLSTLARHTNET